MTPSVLIVHNAYQQRGGEDKVVYAELQLLADHGWATALFTADNTVVKSRLDALCVAARLPHSRRMAQNLVERLKADRPDIVHVHNFFPLITPAVFDACNGLGIPVVHTLHNYRLLCPGALLMRDDRPCTDCVSRSPYLAVRHACYRDSALATLAVARMVAHHRRRGTWATQVDRFITLTEFACRQFVEAGFPAEKIAVKPNFIDDVAQSARPFAGEAPSGRGARSPALFVGRLSTEKGIDTLLDAWTGVELELRVVGDGPLADRLQRNAHKNRAVVPLGLLDAAAVAKEMEMAAFLIMPSVCFEGFPMVLAEAFAHGIPVIASRLGSMAELVEDGITGLHFTPGDPSDLASKVRWLSDHSEERARMGANARQVYEQKYTPDRNYAMLMDIYDQAISEAARRTGS